MQTYCRRVLRVAVLGLLMCSAWTSSALAVTLSLSPAATSNTYAGTITLQIGGLTNGESVVLQKFLDANTNGVIDAGDWLVEQFSLMDGHASVIGGVTNFNVPGDSTPADGAINAQLNPQLSGIEQRFVGKYIFKLTSPSGRFASLTSPLTVTNSNYAQSFTGYVVCSGTNVPNAAVLLWPGSIANSSPQAGVVANNSGRYTIKAAPGTCALVPLKPGYVADMTAAPALTLGAGATVTKNLSLLPATRTVSGRVVDADNTNVGLPGLLVFMQSTNALAAMGFTDCNGNFTVSVTPSQWRISFDDTELPVTGYLRLQNRPGVDTTTGSSTGVTIALPRGTALIYGSVVDSQNHPLAGVGLYSNDNGSQYQGHATTGQNGKFAVAVRGGAWWINVNHEGPGFSNYIFSGGYNLSVNDGQAIQQNFTAAFATNHITGYVRSNANAPIAGVDVWCQGTINGVSYNAYDAYTDHNGYYSINVANGIWSVQPACDDSPGLTQLGYQCVSQQQVTINNNNGVANFVAQPIVPLQVVTTSLPGTAVGALYNEYLSASGGQPPYSWSLSPGSLPLPAGINLNAQGNLYGYPSASGTFTFTVRLTDAANRTADQTLSIAIGSPSLQVTTTWLPNGTNGVFYSQRLEASGGQTPYSWSLAPGSANLPANLSLSPDGVISGTPVDSGTFYFYARVTDANTATADQFLSLTINNAPLQVNNISLPKGCWGGAYNAQLSATGGQPPYNWSLALGSASLPPTLLLSSSGLISGTPATNGVFNFIVSVTDASFAVANRPFEIILYPRPTLNSPAFYASEFKFLVNGLAGQSYAIQVSSDLINWTSIQVTNAPTDIFSCDLGNRAPIDYRFYRVMVGH